MSQTINDHLLTAYALDQLSGDEKLRVEAALRENPSLAAEVVRVQKTAAYLQATLGKDSQLKLTADRRAALERTMQQSNTPPDHSRSWLRIVWGPYVLGPAVVTALILLVVWQGGVPTAVSPVAEQAEKAAGSPAPIPRAEPPSWVEKYRDTERPEAAPPPAAGGPIKKLPAGEIREEQAGPPQHLLDEAKAKRSQWEEASPRPAPKSEAFDPTSIPAPPSAEKAVSKDYSQADSLVRWMGASVFNEKYEIEINLDTSVGGSKEAAAIAADLLGALGEPMQSVPTKGSTLAGLAKRDASPVRRLLRGEAKRDGEKCFLTLKAMQAGTGGKPQTRSSKAECSVEAITKGFEALARALAKSR